MTLSSKILANTSLLGTKDGWENCWVISDWKKDKGAAGEWLDTARKWNGTHTL